MHLWDRHLLQAQARARGWIVKEFSEVRARVGGIKGVMQKLQDAPPDGKWNPMTLCPFCQGKKTASVYNKAGVDLFICHQKAGKTHGACCSGNRSMGETAYISARLGLSEAKPSEGGPSPAYKHLLELAGCWEAPAARKEDRGSRVENGKTPTPPVPAPAPAPDQKLAGEPPALQTPLPNPVLPEEQGRTGETAEPRPGAGPPVEDDDEMVIAKAIELFRDENRASERFMRKHLGMGAARAQRIMAELENRGCVGPANGSDPREILKLPPKRTDIIKIKIGDEISFETIAPKTTEGGAAAAPPAAGVPAGDGSNATGTVFPPVTKELNSSKPDEKPKLALGLEVLHWFHGRLFPTESQMVPYLEDGGKVPDPLPDKVAKKLKFRPAPLFVTRGLTSISCEALCLRANPPGNESLLQEGAQMFPWDENRASGLWLESNRKAGLGRRPNAQFCGKGQMGKKPETERRGKDDKWVWGFCEPVLIPFFDEAGDLIKLRPHKGGAPAGTVAGRPRIYVPRDYRHCGDIVEKFYTVVICEGEFKAMAIWQTLGLGARLQVDAAGQPLVAANFEPIGVCALPGISYVTNVEMRMDLERWLADVGARRVLVAFDDEDKSDKPMRQRFDAQRDARVLATELSQLLHLDARVCVLPTAWRNSRGKADWDGALVKIISDPTFNIELPRHNESTTRTRTIEQANLGNGSAGNDPPDEVAG